MKAKIIKQEQLPSIKKNGEVREERYKLFVRFEDLEKTVAIRVTENQLKEGTWKQHVKKHHDLHKEIVEKDKQRKSTNKNESVEKSMDVTGQEIED